MVNSYLAMTDKVAVFFTEPDNSQVTIFHMKNKTGKVTKTSQNP